MIWAHFTYIGCYVDFASTTASVLDLQLVPQFPEVELNDPLIIITAPNRSLGQGNVVTPVGHSVHIGEGVCPGVGQMPQMQTSQGWADPQDADPPLGLGRPTRMQNPQGWADHPGCRPTPGVGQTPQCRPPRVGQTCLMQTLPRMQTPLGSGRPLRCRPPWDADPPRPTRCRLPDMVNKRAVRILLERILVKLFSLLFREYIWDIFLTFAHDELSQIDDNYTKLWIYRENTSQFHIMLSSCDFKITQEFYSIS